MKGTARHYAGTGTDLDTYADEELLVERDGDVIRIETDGPVDDNLYPWGSPGISLEMAESDARELALAILAQTAPKE